jgi:recombination protein RecA
MAKQKIEETDKLGNFKADLLKTFGKGTILSANDDNVKGDIIPLSSLTLKHALGVGGFSKNKIYEIIGWESSGKSTLCYDAIANAQKTHNDTCLLIDKENSFDKFYAQELGVDLEKLELVYPDSLEDCYAVIEKALDSKLFGLIIIDSLTSFQPKSTIENPEGAMGKESRINSNRMRMVNAKIRESNCCIVFINQMREKIGVMFGNPETTSGGNALKFYAHVRIMIRRKEINAITQSNLMHFKIIKNKLAVPMKEAETTIIWGKGFDKESEIFYLAKEFEIIKKHGKKITYGEVTFELSEKDAMDEFYSHLEDNLEMKQEIIDKVLERLNSEKVVTEMNV